jgi:hypothetical protein
MNLSPTILIDRANPPRSQQEQADIEALARMAARLAGRDPDERVKLELGEVVGFEGPMWRYPDFLTRAEQAYQLLA